MSSYRLSREPRVGEQKPFRVTFITVPDVRHTFPVYFDAAQESIRRAVHWKDAPLSVEVLDHLEDRGIVRDALTRVYGDLCKREEGMLYMVDGAGAAWAIPSRQVVAVEVEDPAAPKGAPHIGFRFQPDE